MKLDFSNAFNALHRDCMLRAVKQRLPGLYSFCYSAYSRPSSLFFGDHIIMSSEGTQQGDPLGPLLFSNALHPLLESFESILSFSFLDDVTLGGPIDVVASDVQRIVDSGTPVGFHLNCSKCELAAHPSVTVSDPTLQSFCRVKVGEVTLLGVPLFAGKSLDEAWEKRCADLSRAVSRLCEVGAQEALLLLRASFSAPRVQYLMRCSPSVEHPALDRFDTLLRESVSKISNTGLSDLQWLQASLPINMGGLGIRRVASLALPAFLASAASTRTIQASILVNSQVEEDDCFTAFLAQWRVATCSEETPEPLPSRQSSWDRPLLQQDQQHVADELSSTEQRARWLAVCAPHSGDWLLALPLTSCGLRLDDEAVRIAVSLRLGVCLGAPHTCQCGAMVDARGIHGFVCKKAAGRIARHQNINDLVVRSLVSAGVPASKEPVGLLRTDGKRPDGMSLIPWEGGRMVVWDVTVVATQAESYVSGAAQGAGVVAEQAASRKRVKYSGLSDAYSFLPLAFENLGPMNEEAVLFLRDVGRRLTEASGDRRETFFLFQRISVAIQRFNSVLFQQSFVSVIEPDQ